MVITTTGASPLIELSPVSSPTCGAPWSLHEVAVLLVRERLERRRVEDLAAVGPGLVDGVLGHQRLARPGGRGDQHALAGVERVEREPLEAVEREAAPGFEGRRAR